MCGGEGGSVLGVDQSQGVVEVKTVPSEAHRPGGIAGVLREQDEVGEEGVAAPGGGDVVVSCAAGDPGGGDGQGVLEDRADLCGGRFAVLGQRLSAGRVQGEAAVGCAVDGQEAAGHGAQAGGGLAGVQVLAVQVGQREGVMPRGHEVQGAVVFLGAGAGPVQGMAAVQGGVGSGEGVGVAVHGLHQLLHVVGQGERVLGPPGEVGGGGERQERGVQGTPGGRQEAVAAVVGGVEDDQARTVAGQPVGAHDVVEAPQAAQTLQEGVQGCQVADHDVYVDVEAHVQEAGGDDHQALGALAGRGQGGADAAGEGFAAVAGQAGMQQDQLLAGTAVRPVQAVAQVCVGGLGVGHGGAVHGRAAT